jgi:hypothetical protein
MNSFPMQQNNKQNPSNQVKYINNEHYDVAYDVSPTEGIN